MATLVSTNGRTDLGAGDDVLEALATLTQVLEENAAEERLLASRIREMMQARQQGKEWLDVLNDEEQPGTVHLMSSTLARMSMASGGVRRSLVLALRAEGVTIPTIAQLFGVTHQRVSNLLRRTPGT